MRFENQMMLNFVTYSVVMLEGAIYSAWNVAIYCCYAAKREVVYTTFQVTHAPVHIAYVLRDMFVCNVHMLFGMFAWRP